VRFAVIASNIVVILSASALAAAEPRFARDVRPILSDACSRCHGPDATARQAELRLDTRAGLFATRDDAPLIVPGRPEASLLFQRLMHADADQRMPPADSGKTLSAAQIDVVRRWIAAGATWEDHWAFVPPERPGLPAIPRFTWPKTAIDRFVLSALESRGLTPKPEAAAETLLRRVTLDLTGLPPSPEDVASYRADIAPDRYERRVEQLLASPRHGEHLAVDWLDAARYADTSGYQNDGPRQMWRWRDWVIDAFNANQPFDQFTLEQLAGDLLLDPATTAAINAQPRGYLPRDPHAADRLVATGFQRNHRGNAEGGIIAEEYAVEYVADRVDTAGAVWLGLTVGCARCHSHKYDPLTQTDYYRLFAYFNQVPEYGRAVKEGNSPPYITAPTAAQRSKLAALETAARQAAAEWQSLESERRHQQQAWESNHRQSSLDDFSIDDDLVGRFPVAKEHAGTIPQIDSPHGRAMALDGQQFFNAGNRAKFTYFDAFSAAAWIRPTSSTGGIVSRTSDDAYEDGWTFQLLDGRLQVNLVKRWLDDSIRVETQSAVPLDQWSHVAMSYDGSRTAAGIRIFVDGVVQPLTVHYDFLNQSFTNDEPLRIGSTGTHRRFTGQMADVRVYRRALSAEDVSILAVSESIADILALPATKRTESLSLKLERCFLAEHAPSHIAAAWQRLSETTATLERYRRDELPTVMVMVDQPAPRPTAVLDRGTYDRPRETVTSGVPVALTHATGSVGGTRLDFARWLVHPRHPLTARVVVNNLWQRFFGTGLVKTSEDFGTQGEPPSHPELLDWLAVELVDSGWDLRHIERLIVNSAAYRQSSSASPAEFQADPQNRWLARGPRVRLSAEMLRDQALAVAGLLEERLGGPSIKPFQPPGLWQEIATDTQYEPSPPPDIYRRSLYCYVKRTVANPTMALFDASTREACTVRRSRTNTPLQALTLLNDETFVAAARALGEATWQTGGREPRTVVNAMFHQVTGRALQADESERLLSSWTAYRAEFVAQPDRARAWLRVGLPDDAVVDEAQLADRAACVAIATVLLNLDEVVTKE
jgi:hypothetical protein